MPKIWAILDTAQ